MTSIQHVASLLAEAGRKLGRPLTEEECTEILSANIYESCPCVAPRPQVLECDVVRFQNQKDKWIAFVGLKNGRPYEIFTGLADDEMGIALPKSVTKGKVIKVVQPDGSKRYDFQFVNTRGFKTTVEGLSYKFDREFWNYARLISGVLRYGMPIDQVVHMISGLQMDNDSINSWTTGVARVLKRYIPGAEEELLEGGNE